MPTRKLYFSHFCLGLYFFQPLPIICAAPYLKYYLNRNVSYSCPVIYKIFYMRLQKVIVFSIPHSRTPLSVFIVALSNQLHLFLYVNEISHNISSLNI